MFKNYLIVASKKDKAGINITTALSQYGNFNFYLAEEDVLHEEIDIFKLEKADFVIFASRHESQSKEKTISIHAPGNWGEAKFGGKPNLVCKTSALFQKQFFETLAKNMNEYNLHEYKLTLECTHHGPYIDKPCIFVEIGSTEFEWNDRRAAFLVAKTIKEIIETYKENPFNEVAVGIGGPHYCPGFNKIQLNSNVAISHVIPQYVFPLTEQMIKEAIKQTTEEVDFVLLDWKGLGNAEQREQVIALLDRMYIHHKKTGDIAK